MTPWAPRSRNASLSGMIPLCGAYFLASTFILALPMWVGAVVGANVATEPTAGWLATLELGTVALTMLLASRRQAFESVRVHAAFAALAIGGYTLSAIATSLWLLAPMRIVAGSGFGWLLAATLAAAARRDNPTRTFGIMEIALALYATGFYAVAGRAIQAAGMTGGFLAMAAALLLCAPGITALRTTPRRPTGVHAQPPLTIADWAGIGAHFLFFVAMYSIWTFLSHKGHVVGVNAKDLGSLLSIAFVSGLAGAALTMLVIPAFGRRIVIPVGLLFLAGAMLLLGRSTSADAFYLTVILIKFGFLLYTVSMSGHFAATDSSGRLNTIGLAMAMIGSSIGPALGGYGLAFLGFGGLSVVVAAGWLLSGILAYLATRRTAPRPNRLQSDSIHRRST